ncbi:hypothetical protein [Thiobaca trueperi]|uniref:Uncharacterized protein n=1 Tax=Thiobaca trueperi TaxID=127458 RepID=A0A4R3MZT3_9GAMM|nr:hypothetical protein [Thiobaca trueperi]TCT20273.1 hypothetical protein EDC35_106200 [Thiobaca trueperi]
MNTDDDNDAHAARYEAKDPRVAAMSLAELREAQERLTAGFRAKYERGEDTPYVRPSLEAHRDLFWALAGQRLGEDCYPGVLSKLALNPPSLRDFAREACEALHGRHAAAWDDRQIFAQFGPGTAHLGDLLADFASRLALSRTPSLLKTLLKICRPVELNNYHAGKVGTVELESEIEAADTSEQRPWQNLTPKARAEDLALVRSPIRLFFSEILIANDDIQAIARMVESTLIAAAQNELRAAFALLNQDHTLSDGQPAFHAAGGNSVIGTPEQTGLGLAIGVLRNQIVNGSPADCEPKFLLCPAGSEHAARKIVCAMYGDSNNRAAPEVLPTAYLEKHWYLFSDPEAWPVLARATLRGEGGQSLRLRPGNPKPAEGDRALVLTGSHVYDYAVVSRTGCVRMTFD